eukprot:4716063-Pyramimonas_sp.AAC.1
MPSTPIRDSFLFSRFACLRFQQRSTRPQRLRRSHPYDPTGPQEGPKRTPRRPKRRPRRHDPRGPQGGPNRGPTA